MVIAGMGGHIATRSAQAQTQQSAYAAMAPVDQYLIPSPATEIALARSAAPPSISADADVMVLGRTGYSTAAFFVAGNAADGWGANRDGGPVLATNDRDDRLTVMLVGVGHWSDGTAAGKT